MKCPNCGLINPDSALGCDCGYNFEDKKINKEKTIVNEKKVLLRIFLLSMVWISINQIPIIPVGLINFLFKPVPVQKWKKNLTMGIALLISFIGTGLYLDISQVTKINIETGAKFETIKFGINPHIGTSTLSILFFNNNIEIYDNNNYQNEINEGKRLFTWFINKYNSKNAYDITDKFYHEDNGELIKSIYNFLKSFFDQTGKISKFDYLGYNYIKDSKPDEKIFILLFKIRTELKTNLELLQFKIIKDKNKFLIYRVDFFPNNFGYKILSDSQ